MSALPSWNLAFRHLNAGAAASPPDPESLKQAFETAARQDRDLVAGIAAYRRDPYFRNFEEPPLLWAEAETRLLDFGGTASGQGPAVLFVPSLINRAYILDLMEGGSMLRWLSGQGMHPYLLDWGWPGAAELLHFAQARLRCSSNGRGPRRLSGAGASGRGFMA